MQNENYANSYRKEAKKIKNQKIWKNFRVGVGVGFSVGLVLAVKASASFM
jgi:hypothetical protein